MSIHKDVSNVTNNSLKQNTNSCIPLTNEPTIPMKPSHSVME